MHHKHRSHDVIESKVDIGYQDLWNVSSEARGKHARSTKAKNSIQLAYKGKGCGKPRDICQASV